ncbi:MAG: OmpA family protein [Rhodocyclaceae bacterium]|nr:OmpA family protein [Rhodocyclaceae bacterium]
MNVIERVALIALAACLPLGAQAQDRVLRGADITESALIEALTPQMDAEGGTPAASTPGVRTRSIKIMRDQPEAPAKQVAKKAQASLLITFETNSADLRSEAKDSLDVVGKALQADSLAKFNFAIEGHADPRGGDDLNYRLSQARAESVMNYLVGAHGIDRSRLKAEGKGSSELLNADDPTAPENRRVTITTLK